MMIASRMKNSPQRRVAAGLFSASVLLALAMGGAQAAPPTQPINPQVGLPTLTYTFVGAHPVVLGGNDYVSRQYLFNITGFSVPGGDPSGYYTIFSFSNSTLQANTFGVDAFNLPAGWTFAPSDFVISTSRVTGIFATDPQFGLTIYQTPGATPITPADAPFEVYHQVSGVQPFTLNGQPVIIHAQPVPEASTAISLGFGLLGLGGAFLRSRRRKMSA